MPLNPFAKVVWAPNRWGWRDTRLLLLVMAVAAFPRLIYPSIVEYRYDEALYSLMAQNALDGGALPLMGVTMSNGFPSPAIHVYVFMALYSLTDNPVVVTAGIALLNVLGVGGLYWLGQRLLGWRVALIAALLLACSPWAILYSRKIWQPNLTIPFMVIALAALIEGLFYQRRWGLWVALPLFVIAIQTHPIAVIQSLLVLWLLWMGRREIRWGAVVWGIALGLVVITPYALGMVGGWAGVLDVPSMSSRVADYQVGGGRYNPLTLMIYQNFITGTNLQHEMAYGHADALLGGFIALEPFWRVILLGLLWVGIIGVWWRGRVAAGLICLWLLIPLAVLLPGDFATQWHYITHILPAFFLAIAVGIDVILRLIEHYLHPRWMQRAGCILVIGVWVGIMVTQLLAWEHALRYSDSIWHGRGFGTPVHYLLDVREALLPYQDVVLLTDPPRSVIGWNATYFRALLWRQPICLRATNDSMTVLPSVPHAILVPPESELTLTVPANRVTLIPQREGEGDYRLYTFEQAAIWHGEPITPIAPVPLTSGVALIGASVSTEQVLLQWQIQATDSPVTQYRYLLRYLDRDRQLLSQHEADFLPSESWCADDQLVTRLRAVLPNGATTLQVSMSHIQFRVGRVQAVRKDNGASVVELPLGWR
ncbi:MAG: ArnT family glycosyltransferase [Phototrophicaceae bacterium]